MKQFIHRIYVVCLLAMLFIQVAAQRFVNVSFEGAQTVCAITAEKQHNANSDNTIFLIILNSAAL